MVRFEAATRVLDSVGPPDEIDDDEVGPDDAAKPRKPSERGERYDPDADDPAG